MELITDEIKKEIIFIWDKYISENSPVLDVKGKDIENIDGQRIAAIPTLKTIIEEFLKNNLTVGEFKTSIDSFNKQNNLWGFTSIKGQMFFNLLVKNNDTEDKLSHLKNVLIKTISIPFTIDDALNRIEQLEQYCLRLFTTAPDKRKVPNPGSVGYFLSYFWQIQNHEKWPVMYSSMIAAWTDIKMWKHPSDQKNSFHLFWLLNHEIKTIISGHSKKDISNWDVEHAFWNYKGNIGHAKTTSNKQKSSKETLLPITDTTPIEETETILKSNFELSDYIIPKVARLVELGNQTDKSAASKGSEFEKLVSEIFKLLDFEVEYLGQGSGRNPDAIIKSEKKIQHF